MERVYRQKVITSFSVDRTCLVITDYGSDYACIEEDAKNGQEDTHMKGTVELREDGKFDWSDEDNEYNLFAKYASQKFADDIVEFFNKHGLPSHENCENFI